MFDNGPRPTSAALSREVRLRPALEAPHVSYRGYCCQDCDEAARQFMTHSGHSTAAAAGRQPLRRLPLANWFSGAEFRMHLLVGLFFDALHCASVS
jgi:hypothetical protein